MACILSFKILAKSILLILVFIGLLHVTSASTNSISDLWQLIASFDDPKITEQDLAFYLIIHNYDVIPKDGFVELKLNETKYELIPNGDKPGLCDILPIEVTK